MQYLAQANQHLSAAVEAYQQAAEALRAQGDLQGADDVLAKAKACGYVEPSPVEALCKQGRFQEAAVEQQSRAKEQFGHDQVQAYLEAARLFGLANASVRANQCTRKAAKCAALLNEPGAAQMFRDLAVTQHSDAADLLFKASLCDLACDLDAEAEFANEFAHACKNRDRETFTEAAIALDSAGRLDRWTTAMLYTIKCSF